jgi:Tfp pilus assembly protein PilN
VAVRLNLLPEAYQKSRRHDRRLRLGLAAGSVLLVAELCAGLTLHMRADKTRAVLAEAEHAKTGIETVKQKLEETTSQWELLNRQVELATRLRATHRWSRLLAMLAHAAPEKVVLTNVSTEPPKWTPNLARKPDDRTSPRSAKKQSQDKPILSGILVRGYAVDHEELAAFVAAVQESEAFAAINLGDARRETFLGQDAIAFELQCNW